MWSAANIQCFSHMPLFLHAICLVQNHTDREIVSGTPPSCYISLKKRASKEMKTRLSNWDTNLHVNTIQWAATCINGNTVCTIQEHISLTEATGRGRSNGILTRCTAESVTDIIYQKFLTRRTVITWKERVSVYGFRDTIKYSLYVALTEYFNFFLPSLYPESPSIKYHSAYHVTFRLTFVLHFLTFKRTYPDSVCPLVGYIFQFSK